jgi:AcrR family transcriptional regulator
MSKTLYVQARSAVTHQSICDSFACLLEEMPFEDIGVSEITVRAGCSVGVFYRHFANKTELLRELYRQYGVERASYRATYLAAENWQDLSLQDTVARLVRTSLDEYEQRKGLFQAFSRLPADDEPSRTQMDVLFAGIEGILLRFCGHLRDPVRAARFAFFIISSTGKAAFVSPGALARFIEFDRATLEIELNRVLLAYLTP